MGRDVVNIYATSHLMAAHTGVAMFRAAASRHQGSPWDANLQTLVGEVEADRASLEEICWATGRNTRTVPQRAARQVLMGLGHASRAMHWATALSTVAEMEKLRSGVSAKAVGWEILLAAAAHDQRLSRVDLELLLERAHDQSHRLRTIHLQMTQVLFDTRP